MPSPRRLFCPDCGAVRRGSHQGACLNPACASARPPTDSWVQPTRPWVVPRLHPPEPWQAIDWAEGGVLILIGRQGTGKSRLALLLHQPDQGSRVGLWLSSEMDPGPINAMAASLGVPPPPLFSVDPLNPFESARQQLRQVASPPGSFVVVDSLTPFGQTDALELLNLVIADCRASGRRGVVLSQTNKAEQVAGSNQLLFMPDIEGWVEKDTSGKRRLRVEKNRYGAGFVRYFRITRPDGAIAIPDFGSIVHSVEGESPDYELVRYGLASGSIPGTPGQARSRRFQWAGLLDALAPYGMLPSLAGRACAIAPSPATASGFMEPEDVDDRRELAVAHGLRWLPLEEGVALLQEAERREAEAKRASGVGQRGKLDDGSPNGAGPDGARPTGGAPYRFSPDRWRGPFTHAADLPADASDEE